MGVVPNYGIEKQKTNRFSPLWCWEAHKALASLVLFHSLPGQRKKRAFRTQHLTAVTTLRIPGHGS